VIPQEQFAGAIFPAPTFCRAGFARIFTCGWLTHGRFLFFARAKKRNQKKARPGAREPFLRSSLHRALANSPGAEQRASGSNTGSLKNSRWGCGTRRALRVVKTLRVDTLGWLLHLSSMLGSLRQELEKTIR